MAKGDVSSFGDAFFLLLCSQSRSDGANKEAVQ